MTGCCANGAAECKGQVSISECRGCPRTASFCTFIAAEQPELTGNRQVTRLTRNGHLMYVQRRRAQSSGQKPASSETSVKWLIDVRSAPQNGRLEADLESEIDKCLGFPKNLVSVRSAPQNVGLEVVISMERRLLKWLIAVPSGPQNVELEPGVSGDARLGRNSQSLYVQRHRTYSSSRRSADSKRCSK